MPKFIECAGGTIVNLDHVARVRRGKQPPHEKSKIPLYTFYDAEDRTLGELTHADLDLVYSNDPVVPAEPSSMAYAVRVGVAGGRPTEASVWCNVYQIVAWRIHDEIIPPTPVLSENPASNETLLIVLPDGRMLHQMDCEYPDLEAAKASILLEAQQDWDARHSREADRAGTESERIGAK